MRPLDPDTKDIVTRKLQTIISYGYKFNNDPQNTTKSNPAFNGLYTIASGVYLRNAWLIHDAKIDQCNVPY